MKTRQLVIPTEPYPIPFIHALEYLGPLEGGYSDRSDDLGGPTKWGVSLRYLKLSATDINGDGHIDIRDVQDMTLPQKAQLYFEDFWKYYKLDKLSEMGEGCPTLLTSRIFSMLVHMRSKDAVYAVQRALRAMGYYNVAQDGILGSQTMGAIMQAGLPLLSCIRSEQAAIYRVIAAANPNQIGNLAGWLNRAYAL